MKIRTLMNLSSAIGGFINSSFPPRLFLAGEADDEAFPVPRPNAGYQTDISPVSRSRTAARGFAETASSG